MSKTVKIPECMNPFVIIVNGKRYEYTAGETVSVPDEVASVIENHMMHVDTAPNIEALNQSMNIRADFAQNNPAAMDYIKNRPFGDLPDGSVKKIDPKYLPDRDSQDAGQLTEAINTALAQAKASGAFDGADGAKGEKGDKGDKGDPGANGKDGADGKTPVKGEDYYTDADKTEMVNAVLSALPTWTGGSY